MFNKSMGKLRYQGKTGQYAQLTNQQLRSLLIELNVVGRSKLTTRIQMINALEAVNITTVGG